VAEVIRTSIDVAINTSKAAAELKKLQTQINAFNLTLNKGSADQLDASKRWASGLSDIVNNTQFFRAETVKMQTSAGALDSVLKRGSATMGQFFSAAFNRRGTMFAETTALASERVRTLQTQFIATSKASGGMQDALAIRPLSAFSSQASIAAQRMTILSAMFKQGTTNLINFGKNVQWAGRQLMVGFTVPLTIFGTAATKVFRDLETEVVNFKKVYGDLFTTDLEVETNLNAIKELTKEFTKYGIAAKETMMLAAIGAQAGKEGAELQAATIQATRLSVLGDIDRQTAMKTTIALQSAFKLSNEELANSINFLNLVENSSVVSLQNLTDAIPRVAPVIVGLGGDIKDMAVFLAAMQEGGVNAAEAANGLKSSLGRLISPTKQAKEMANEFGISLEKIVEVNEGNVLGMVISLSESMKQLTDLQKQQLLSAVFGKFQFARMGALFENITKEGSQASRIIEMMDTSIEDLAATADKELGAIENSIGTQLTAAIERFKLELAPVGEIFAKIAIPLLNFATKILEAFNSISDSKKNLLGIAALVVGVVVPAFTMFFGLIMNLLGNLSKFGQLIFGFFTNLARKGPIGAVKSLTQSTKYLSLAEIDAANAARQLGSATEITNAALLKQAGAGNSATAAINSLTASYRLLVAEQARAVATQPALFATGRSIVGKSLPIVKRNKGGEIFTLNQGNRVPGVGNTDTVPAMLTPGEFVVNKESTQNNLDVLKAINSGTPMNLGGQMKGGILHAMAGAIARSFGAKRASTFIGAETGAFAVKGRATTRRVQSTRTSSKQNIPPGQVIGKKDNFVYGFQPLTNQQLKGNAIYKEAGFDRMGVPAAQIKKEMLSKDGMFFIDSYAGGPWNRKGYEKAVSGKIDAIVANNPGKEIRFLDKKGLGRVLNNPGLKTDPRYKDIKFLSVADIHDKNVLSYLEPNHIQRLKKIETQTQMLARGRSREFTAGTPMFESVSMLPSTYPAGTTVRVGDQVSGAHLYQYTGEKWTRLRQLKARPTDVSIGPDSYHRWSKGLKNWRGEKRPEGIHASHVFNDGGMVPIQKLRGGGLLRALFSTRGGLPSGKRRLETNEEFFRISEMFGLKKAGGVNLNAPMTRANKEGLLLGDYSIVRGHQAAKRNLSDTKSYHPALMFFQGNRANTKLNTGISGAQLLKDFQAIESRGLYPPSLMLAGLQNKGIPLSREVLGRVDEAYKAIKLKLEKESSRIFLNEVYTKEMELILKEKLGSLFNPLYSIGTIRSSSGGSIGTGILSTTGQVSRFNKGNIVPGVGNTDTVPAMLTPGEFVINKESTKQNYDLLTAINNGSLAGYNKGGRIKNGILYAEKGAGPVKPTASKVAERFRGIQGNPVKPKPVPIRGAGPIGMAAGVAASIPLFSEGAVENLGTTGSMVASIAAFFAAQKVATGLINKFGSSLKAGAASTNGVATAATSLQKSLFRANVMFRAVLIPVLGPIAAIALATVGVFTIFGKTMEKIRKSGEEFNNAMFGSSEGLKNMAKAVGRATPSEQMARQNAEILSGARVTQEDIEFSSKFMQTEESKQLLKDLETVKKMGGDQAKALKNQLGQAVLSGIFTPEEAKQIAVDIGLALKNEKLSVDAVAQLTNLFGPDGKKLENNKIQILTEISAPEDIETIVQQSERELERIQKAHFRFWEKGTGFDSALAFQKFFMLFEPNKEALELSMQMNTLQNNVIENLAKEKELRSQIQLELQNGVISLEKYNSQINTLNQKTSKESITNAIKATGISEEELSKLKFNAPAGAIGTGVLGTGVDAFKTLGGMRYGGIEKNIGLSREAQEVENLIERLKDALKIDLEDSGFTEDEITIILKNSSESFGKSLEDQAYLFGDILEGRLDAAVFGMVNLLKENDLDFNKALVDLAKEKGFVETKTVEIPARSTGRGVVPARTEEVEIDRSAELGTQLLSPFRRAPGLFSAVKGSIMGDQAPGQGITEDPVLYAERLEKAYQTIQALPKDLVFALKLDINSPIDIFKHDGQDIEAFKRNWNVLDGLDPSLDKTFVFNAIGVDSNGKPRPIDDLIKDTKAVNEAIKDLNSGDKKVVAEAELKLATVLNANSDLSPEEITNQLSGLKESYKDIWDSIDAGTKTSLILLTALVNGTDDPEEIKKFNEQIKQLVDLARVQPTDDNKETGPAKESAFQKIMKSTKATKDYMKAIADLVKRGLKPENIALIDQADLLEMSVEQRKKAIRAVKEQIDIQKALEYLMKSTSERRIFDLDREVKLYDRNITLIERQIEDVEKLNKVEQNRIDALSRQNEMDQRQLAIKNRGLDLLSRKEDEVNKVYDARSKALDKVAKINERVARQQQSRVTLATALTSGDIAGAASAAAQMAAQYAQDQEEDARAALESQKQRELENLAVSINGVLMTRSQIEAQILQINDRIYDRNLEIQKLEDIIYHRKQTLIKPLEENINKIMEDRKVKIREIEDLQFKNWQSEMNRIDQLIAKYKDLNTIKGGGSGSTSSSGPNPSKGPNPGPGPTVTPKPSPNFSLEIAKDKKTSGNTPSAQERQKQIADDKKTSGNTPSAQQRQKQIADDKKTTVKTPPPVTRRDLKAFGGSIKNFAMGGSVNKYPMGGLIPYAMGGSVKKYAMGGMIGFRGSREAPPPVKMAFGSIAPGMGNTDRVPALLTPGEFVVRKSATKENLGLLKALNGDIFPSIGKNDLFTQSPTIQESSSSINNMPVYNTYSINVNVPNSNASPEEIANVVISKIQRSSMSTIRTTRRS
jgi:TP901 family phage tail tape measure protein